MMPQTIKFKTKMLGPVTVEMVAKTGLEMCEHVNTHTKEAHKAMEQSTISACAICPFLPYLYIRRRKTLSHHTHADSTAPQPSALWQEGVMTRLLPVLCSDALYNEVQFTLPRDPQKSVIS